MGGTVKIQTDKERLEALIKKQFDMDDHGIYIYGLREDYTNTATEHIAIDDKITSQLPPDYHPGKDT